MEGTFGDSAAYESQIWAAADTWAPESGPTVVTAQAEAQTCVDTALGAPDVYKNIMFDYLTKARLSRFQRYHKNTLGRMSRAHKRLKLLKMLLVLLVLMNSQLILPLGQLMQRLLVRTMQQ